MGVPSTMRAAQWSSSVGGIEKNMTVKEVPLPKDASSLPPDSTLVKVHFSSLNPIDYKLPELPLIGRLLNRIPCCDFSGTVVSTMNPDLKPGDRVFGMTDPGKFGALAEYVVVDGRQRIVQAPSGVALRSVAGLGVAGLMAYQCIVPFVKPGDNVLVNGGSGGIGTYGIEIAKALGCRVTATCSGSNFGLCKSLGADEVIDYRTTDVVQHLIRQNVQYALLFDTAYTPALYWSAHHYLKSEGLYIPLPPNPSVSTIWTVAMIFMLPKIVGGGQRTPKFVRRQLDAAQYAEIAAWMKDGKLRTVVEKEYELESVADAFSRLKSGNRRGKIIIRIAEEG